MNDKHIVKSFDEELKLLRNLLAQMGGLAEQQLESAMTALEKGDVALANRIVEADQKVDELEDDIDELAIRILALRQPVAVDLRLIVGAIRIGSDIERIADYAKNIAKRAIALQSAPPIRVSPVLLRMARLVQTLIRDTLDAFVANDAEKARQVRQRDAEVDALYNSVFRELLTYMMEDPRSISSATHMLFIAKNIERIGDHTTNVAEYIYFTVHGRALADERPKGDVTSFAVVNSPDRKG